MIELILLFSPYFLVALTLIDLYILIRKMEREKSSL